MERPEQLAITMPGGFQIGLSPVAVQRDRRFRLAAFVDNKQRAAIGCPGKAGLAVVPRKGSAAVHRDCGPQEFLVVVSEIESDEGFPDED